MPYRCRTGRPLSTTSWPRSYTAPSTQPPETEPTAVSSGPTSIEAPGGRGADRKVATTVPTPISSPLRHHSSSSGRTSRISQHLHQVGIGRQRVAGDEVVTVGKRGEHPGLDGLVAVLAPVGVHPHHAMSDPLQPGHLLGEHRRITSLPSVTEH